MPYERAGLTRREIALALPAVVGIGAISSAALAASPLTPEAFGAVGDGVASDGAAVARLVQAINAVPGSDLVEVECRGRYLLRGAPVRGIAPKRMQLKGGLVAGIPAIIRSNVTINAWGAEFIVPPEFGFRRLKRGGDNHDQFFVGLQFLGHNCSLRGGTFKGNLQNRTAERGPLPKGFGGNEFGLVMEGEGWLLEDVTSENWGTDCLLIAAQGISRNGRYIGGRRNCVSVVVTQDILHERPIIIEGGVMHRAGAWPDHIYNNPGAGIDIEGRASASVVLSGIDFADNRLKDIQISKEAYRCTVENCRIRNRLLFRPHQRGGHIVNGNHFLGGSQAIRISETYPNNESISFEGNRCTSVERFIVFHRSRVKSAVAQQRIIGVENIGCSI